MSAAVATSSSRSSNSTHPPDSSAPAGSPSALVAPNRSFAGLRAQFRQLPRLLQIGVVAVLIAGGYALCKATTWQWATEATDKADALQRELDLAGGRPSVDRSLRNIVIGQGEIRLPQDADTATQAMFQAYQDLVEARKDVQKPKHSPQQNAAPLGRGASTSAFVPAGRKAEKVITEISFESSPEVAAEVIAGLESSPAIDAISSIKITGDEKGNSKMVKVRLSVEAWIAGMPRR